MRFLRFCLSLLLIHFSFGLQIINLVLLVDEKNGAPKAPCRIASEGIKGVKVEMKVIELKENMTQAMICEALMGEEGTYAPTLAIDATQESDRTVSRISDMVKTLLRTLGVPTISVTPTFNPWPGKPLEGDELEYLVKIQPPDLTMAGVIKSIVAQDKNPKNIKSFMVLHDESFDYQNKVGLIFDNIACAIAIEKIITDEESINSIKNVGINATMNRIEKSDVGNIFVLAKVATINEILSKASDMNMFKPQFGWFAISKESGKLACPTCVNGSVVYIQPAKVNENAYVEFNSAGLTTPDVVESAFFFDLTKGVLNTLILEIGQEGKWPEVLTYGKCPDPDSVPEKPDRALVKLKTLLETKSISGVYGNFNFKPINPNSKKAVGFQEIKLEIFHNWMNLTDVRSVSKLFWKKSSSKSEPSTELTGDGSISNYRAIPMLRISTVLEPPFIYKQIDKNGDEYFEGFCIDLLNEIRALSNLTFEYRIFVTKDGTHGNLENFHGTNITWTGMIGDIVKGSADLALGPIAVMAERETAVDFTIPYYDLVGISILMKRNEPKSSLFKFLTVLEANVWACIIGAYFFTSFLMFLFDRLSPYSYHNNKEKYKDDEETRDFSLKESLWFCITSLTPQGGGEAPRNLSGRLVAATWWLFGFIIIASYTANLAAFLTVSRLDSTIESLDDLAKQYKIKYAPVEGSTAKTYFERMAAIEERFYEIWKNMSLDDSLNETERAKLAVWDYPVSDKYTKIWWTMKETKFKATLEDAIEETLKSSGPQDGFALIAESTKVRYATMQHCELTQVGSEFSRKPLAIALPKGSEYREKMNFAILKILNERKLESLKEKWWTNNPYQKKCRNKVKQGDGIAIENIGGVFIVIFIGIVLALLTLLVEFIYFKGKRDSTRVITVKDFSQSSKDPIRR